MVDMRLIAIRERVDAMMASEFYLQINESVKREKDSVLVV